MKRRTLLQAAPALLGAPGGVWAQSAYLRAWLLHYLNENHRDPLIPRTAILFGWMHE